MSCSDNIAQYVENQGVIHTFTVTQTWIDPDLGLQHHGTGSGAFHYVVNEDPGDGGPLFYLVGSAQMSLDPRTETLSTSASTPGDRRAPTTTPTNRTSFSRPWMTSSAGGC